MIRPNYHSHGGWTFEEYKHFWEGERKMEKIITEGKFPTVVRSVYNSLKPKNTMKPIVIILCGIPTSGKSTWAKDYTKRVYELYHGNDMRISAIISRDQIRLHKFGIKYKQNNKDEQLVTKIFDDLITTCIEKKLNIIIDNAHTVPKYLNASIQRFKNTDYSVNIKFFDIPLWLAYYRNVTRYWRTGKWIPFKVINRMKKNYKNLNKDMYAKYRF